MAISWSNVNSSQLKLQFCFVTSYGGSSIYLQLFKEAFTIDVLFLGKCSQEGFVGGGGGYNTIPNLLTDFLNMLKIL